MGEKANAFAKGGCGCLIAFAVLACFFLVIGGSAHIDLCGAAMLFVIGGFIGLVVLAIYNSGKRAATRRDEMDLFQSRQSEKDDRFL